MNNIKSLKSPVPLIRTLSPKIIVGNALEMSISENKTFDLWRNLMPRLGELKNRTNAELLSIQIFPKDFDFANFDIHRTFLKWAGAEVNNTYFIPEGMQILQIPGGDYAVFNHIGDASTAQMSFTHIFSQWLPNSEFEMDNRPHFEILGEKYKRNDPNSEEDIYIPIKRKML